MQFSTRLTALLSSFVVFGFVTPAEREPTYSDVDAELLAMELSGEFLPPPDLYERLHGDLEAIRAAHPGLALVRHWPLWVPGELVVGFDVGCAPDLQELNERFGPVEVTDELRFPWTVFWTLRFPRRYNPECLARLYAEVPGVKSAEANFIGTNCSYPGPDDVQVELPRYVFTWYFMTWTSTGPPGCSPEGCEWTFEVNDRVPELKQQLGPPDPITVPRVLGVWADDSGSVILQWRGPRCNYEVEVAQSLDQPVWLEVLQAEWEPWVWNLGDTAGSAQRFFRVVATRAPDR
jgi:hypothetical protein